MNQDSFEKRILEIWVRSRVSLTAAHVQHLTGAPRHKVKGWLDDMTAAGVLDVDVDDEGEMIWKVRGAERAARGPVTVAELEHLDRLTAEVGGATRALAGERPRASSGRARPSGEHKSVVASGVLSLFFGPLGWLYAAPLRERPCPGDRAEPSRRRSCRTSCSRPCSASPRPLRRRPGVYSAWRHNQTGERTGLFSDKKDV